MDTLLSIKVFCEVVRAGSFNAAARHLGISNPMASKHVVHLEQHVGARLLHRTSRKLSLTEAGRLYYDKCIDALDVLDQAEAVLGDRHGEPSGVLRVTAPVWFASNRIAQLLVQYQNRYPRVVLDLYLTNSKIELAEAGMDLAIRVTHDPEPQLIVRKVGQVPLVLVSSPDYIGRMGQPQSVQDLERFGAVMPNYRDRNDYLLQGPAGTLKFQLQSLMKVSDTTLSRKLVLAGMGVAMLPAWLVEDDLRQGRLLRLLPDHESPPLDIFASYMSRQYQTGKVRSFIDFFSEAMAGSTVQ
ncbi:LysR family transcriptional regulator [Advenella mimigardefordensis]|uniref:Transcriptional regulator, LysR family n=1 Tax=Advenella mimigardefordensis (strain DSM 17166 / LMG 22922 / DPN7) TaxID=1247726 RepID=W0PBX7_ADVMD|nr:LysR family transcriptional regulator [Advenella mimigardefordensis]AHG62992.1 transcriptional regulator, LysR family [Advenella mimigardefordensis DPN7]